MAGWFSDLDPRLAILLPGVIGWVPGAIALWQWWTKRQDDREDVELSRDERRTRELDAQQSVLDAEKARWFGDLRQENRDLRTELAETRRDRDRGWNLARGWHSIAHDLRRAFSNLRHNAANMMQWIRSANMRHPELALPETIDPVPERIDIPMGLEDIKAGDL